jgi:arsenate reductase (thioredoxin)
MIPTIRNFVRQCSYKSNKVKFFGGSSKDEKNKKTVLFVCVQNAGRSQIAEAFFRKYAPNNYEALSAGIEPVGNINPLAIEAMKEVGIDISKRRPKIITEDMIRQSTARVNVGSHLQEKEDVR